MIALCLIYCESNYKMTERNPYAPPLSVVKDVDNRSAQGNAARVEYKNTFLDLFRYTLATQFRTPFIQITVCFFAGFASFEMRRGIAVAIMTFIIVYIILWIMQIVFTFLLLLFTKRKTLTNWHIITITDEGLLEESQFNRTLTFWSGGSMKVKRLAGCIAIYVTPFSAHCVPIRAFSTKGDAACFQHELEQKIRANRGA